MRVGCVAALAAVGFMLAAGGAAADEAARTAVARTLETGRLAEGVTELQALAAGSHADEALFGLGMVEVVQAVEQLSQGLYRYGLQPPRSLVLPLVRLPVPVNPAPEAIHYDKFRGIVARFVADLDAAQKTLARMGTSGVKIPVDLAAIRYDANGDGTIGEDERFATVLARIMRVPPANFAGPAVVAFDNGDALWLQGYCHALEALGEFLLAYDWHEGFDDSFHIFFPRTHSAFQAELAPPGEGFFASEVATADLISFLHIRWPLAEPARMAAVRDHLKALTGLSRASWRAIAAETDDDHEWIPNPNQTSVTGTPVTAEQIAAWAAVLDRVDALLDGNVLMPHWRFTRGIDLKRVFTEPRPFDLVLWITGPAALPYLADGPVLTGGEWNDLTRAFRGSFGSYAIWFN